MQHVRDVHVPNQGSGERGTSEAGSGDGRMESGERVQRVAVMGEREAGNELNEQRWLERGKREKLEGRDRTMRHRALDAVFVVCPKFLFLKKNDDGDVSRPIVVGLLIS